MTQTVYKPFTLKMAKFYPQFTLLILDIGKQVLDNRYALCRGNGRQESAIKVGPDKLEMLTSFRYIADMISVGRGCGLTVTTHAKTHIPQTLLQGKWSCEVLLLVEHHHPCQ